MFGWKKKSNENMESYNIYEIREVFHKFRSIYQENYRNFYREFSKIYTIEEERRDLLRLVFGRGDMDFITGPSVKSTYLRSELFIGGKDEIARDLFPTENKDAINSYNILLLLSNFFGNYKFFNKNGDMCYVNAEPVSYDLGTRQYGRQNYVFHGFVMIDDLDGIDNSTFLRAPSKPDDTYTCINKSHYDSFESLKNFIHSYEQDVSNDLLFDLNGNLKDSMKYHTLENYDLKKVVWEDKRIDGIDITKNKEVDINFDKIRKDVHDANFRGYNLKPYRLIGFNIIDTNLRETNANIDLATCNFSYPGKMCKGTQFDETNTFYLGERELTHEEVESLGIKIYKKGER